MDSWTVDDVQSFLEQLSLPGLKHLFAKNGVDGKDLLALSKQDLKDELGCTELQARKIVEAVAALSPEPASSASPAPYIASGAPAPYVGQPVPTTTYQPLVVQAPAPGVVANGYFYQPRERFVGGITWVIAVCFCFPCIFCCPVDEREARVNVVVPVQPAPTQPAVPQTMTQTIH